MSGDYYYAVFLFLSAESSETFSQIVLSFAWFFKRILFIFREAGEKERERNIDVW